MPVAIVTGAGKRIGRGLALAMAEDGYDIAVHYRSSKPEAEETVRDVEAMGRRAMPFRADLGIAGDIEAMMANIRTRLGPAQCLINSASLFDYDLADNWTVGSFDRHMAVNLRAPLHLAQRLIEDLPDGVQGCVINLLDQKLFNLNPDFYTYTLSKLGLKGATEMLAQAVAPKCRVNAVAPGLTLQSGDQSQEQFAQVHAMTPMGRGTSIGDIADAVRYLVRATAVTGAVLPVDCGQRLSAMDRDVMFLDPDRPERPRPAGDDPGGENPGNDG